jgi:mevalonate kinase
VARAIAAVLPGHGLYVAIRSDLPIGRGMGSSAALAVALVRAAARYEGRTLSDDETWERGFAVERIFHGNPSGVDHAVAARGGALWYTRGPPPTFRPLPTPGWSLVVLDSGTAGDTQQMVSGVASRRPGVDADLAAIGALVSRVEAAWSDPPALGALLHENHVLLQRIGVSTPALDALVDLATSHGAWGAKLCGAGGGGVVAALHPDPARLLTAARSAGIDAFEVRAM